MKQSTKLLSLVLALVMAFSCMTVIGNAALVKSEVTWDSLDDAALAPQMEVKLYETINKIVELGSCSRYGV